jgi:hypothetical protein
MTVTYDHRSIGSVLDAAAGRLPASGPWARQLSPSASAPRAREACLTAISTARGRVRGFWRGPQRYPLAAEGVANSRRQDDLSSRIRRVGMSGRTWNKPRSTPLKPRRAPDPTPGALVVKPQRRPPHWDSAT